MMKNKDLLETFGQVDRKYILESAPGRSARKRRVLRVVLVAAAVALLAGALTLTVFANRTQPEDPTPAAPVGESETTKTAASVQTPDTTPTEQPTPSVVSTVPTTPEPTRAETDPFLSWGDLSGPPMWIYWENSVLVKITKVSDERIETKDSKGIVKTYIKYYCEPLYVTDSVSIMSGIGASEEFDAARSMFEEGELETVEYDSYNQIRLNLKKWLFKNGYFYFAVQKEDPYLQEGEIYYVYSDKDLAEIVWEAVPSNDVPLVFSGLTYCFVDNKLPVLNHDYLSFRWTLEPEDLIYPRIWAVNDELYLYRSNRSFYEQKGEWGGFYVKLKDNNEDLYDRIVYLTMSVPEVITLDTPIEELVKTFEWMNDYIQWYHDVLYLF